MLILLSKNSTYFISLVRIKQPWKVLEKVHRVLVPLPLASGVTSGFCCSLRIKLPILACSD